MSGDTQVVEVEEEIETEQSKEEPSGLQNTARRMGWVPKDQFRGDPDKWIEAAEFVRRGEENLPIARERNRSLERKIERLEKTISDFAEHHAATTKREYDKAYRQIQKELKLAVEDGDVNRYEELSTLKDDLEKTKPAEPVKKDTVQEISEEDQEILTEWITRNKWYETDHEMSAYAFQMGEFLGKTKPGLQGKAQLEEITKEVKLRFPEKFGGNNKRSGVSPVFDSDSSGEATRRSNKKGYADLPADAKAACDKFVKEIPKFTREQYLKDYFGE